MSVNAVSSTPVTPAADGAVASKNLSLIHI